MSEAKERVNGIALGAWIKRQRLLRGMTQGEVADLAEKTQGQIAKLENGQRATVPLEDIPDYARGVKTTEQTALRAIGYVSPGSNFLGGTDLDEEALAFAESYSGFTSPEAREILRQALQYADAVERSHVIGGKRSDGTNERRN